MHVYGMLFATRYTSYCQSKAYRPLLSIEMDDGDLRSNGFIGVQQILSFSWRYFQELKLKKIILDNLFNDNFINLSSHRAPTPTPNMRGANVP